mgnify:FL=1
MATVVYHPIGVVRSPFATRGPMRPTPISLTVVRLIDIRDTVLHVEGLDLVNGTPVLDIKSHYPKPDEDHRGHPIAGVRVESS